MKHFVNERPDKKHPNPKHWKDVREEALLRDKNRCVSCNQKENLEVHHRTYERFGNEKLSDVYVLCKTCHKLFTKKNKQTRDSEKKKVVEIANYERKKHEYLKEKNSYEKDVKYFENGKKKYEYSFRFGYLTGVQYEWYSTGKLKLEITYKEIKSDEQKQIREGITRKWRSNGSLEYEEHYVSNELDGLRKIYCEKGQITKVEKYMSGIKTYEGPNLFST